MAAPKQESVPMPVLTKEPQAQSLRAPLMSANATLEEQALELHGAPCFSTTFGALFFPCTFFSSWLVLSEGEQKIILNTGRLVDEIKDPGCYFYNCCQREVRTVSTKKQCEEIKQCKVSDKDGNPIIISAVMVMQVVTPRRVLLGVQNWVPFVKQQGMAILRQVVAKYSYESRDGSPSLRSDTAHINEELAQALDHVLSPVGIKALSFRLDEISFSPEIASLMLKRQAAKAVIEARKVIVEGAVGLTQEAVTMLQSKGLNLTREHTSKLVSNLLTVLCSAEVEA